MSRLSFHCLRSAVALVLGVAIGAAHALNPAGDRARTVVARHANAGDGGRLDEYAPTHRVAQRSWWCGLDSGA